MEAAFWGNDVSIDAALIRSDWSSFRFNSACSLYQSYSQTAGKSRLSQADNDMARYCPVVTVQLWIWLRRLINVEVKEADAYEETKEVMWLLAPATGNKSSGKKSHVVDEHKHIRFYK